MGSLTMFRIQQQHIQLQIYIIQQERGIIVVLAARSRFTKCPNKPYRSLSFALTHEMYIIPLTSIHPQSHKMSDFQSGIFKCSQPVPSHSLMSQPTQRRTRSAGGIERQEMKTGQIEDTAQQPQTVNDDLEKEKEKMMKALKNKGTPAREGEQTQEKQLKMNDQQRKQEKPKKKPKKKAKQDEDEVKDEQQAQKPKKKKKNKAKAKPESEEDEVKEQQVQKPKKKKKSKPKKESSEDQMKEQEESQSQKQKKKQKPKKKKKKKQSQSQEQESQQEDKQKSQKTKKISKKRRGRKATGPVKRKKTSIFQRQQVINKKYRVKKKSHYLNRQSERTWGPMRAGPYRDAKKMSKQEQKQIIEQYWSDGPGEKQKRQKEQKERGEKMEVQNAEQVKEIDENANENGDVKIEEDKSQAPTKKKSKSRSKPKKKKESEESEESEQEQSKPKKKKKPKRKKDDESTRDRTIAASSRVSKRTEESAEVKLQGESVKTVSKKKKKKVVAEQQANTEKQAKIQHDAEQDEGTVKTKRKKKVKNSDEEDEDSASDSGQTKKQSKKDGTKKQSRKKAPSKPKPTKQQDQGFTKEQSQRIINLFAIDGGNYPQMMKQLPGIRLKQVRTHLRMLFHRALDIITYHVQFRVGRKIKEWQQDEKVEIVRELHRIRSSNRLLSESNVQFREKMTALMRSYNDQSELDSISEGDIEFLYKRLQAFVRGYNTINRSKRSTAASITESKHKEKEQRYKFNKEVTRKPIISGGHLLSKSVKSQFQEEAAPSEFDDKSKLIAPEKLVQDWTRQQEKTLCELYVNNTDADESICQQLRQKYGPQAKWRDFQLLDRKIDQLIKNALIKLQNLTARPYSREERRTQMEKKRAKMYEKLRREYPNEPGILEDFYKEKLRNTSMFTYDNELFSKVERLEFKHRIFKNLSLLQRQIFGHLQSYKFKASLVRILIEEFPPEQDVEEAVRQAKKFSRWARTEEKKNNISSIKNVFCGERDDREYGQGDDDYTQQDSIMADIEKVDIIKRVNDGEPKYAESVYFSEDGDNKSISKSKFFGKAQDNEPITIALDDEEVEVSDFEQPESAELKVKNSVQMEIQDEGQGQKEEQFTMLQRLYEKLSKDGK